MQRDRDSKKKKNEKKYFFSERLDVFLIVLYE